MQALTRPVVGPADTFHGDFKDVSGLKIGDDVRLLGVQVGKVTDIAVDQSVITGSRREVTFSVQRERGSSRDAARDPLPEPHRLPVPWTSRGVANGGGLSR